MSVRDAFLVGAAAIVGWELAGYLIACLRRGFDR